MSAATNATDKLMSLLTELKSLYQSAAFPDQAANVQALTDRLVRQEINLAVVGQMKRGKSSLINALLGTDILPTGVLPLTSIITEIRGADETQALVEFKSGITETIPTHDIPQFVTEKQNPGNRKRVLKVKVALPNAFLVPGLVLIDTPGIGSTQSHNSELTVDHLAEIDAALVVFSADPPMTQSEALFLHQLRSKIERLFFVMNKADQVTQRDMHEAVAFLRGELQDRLDISMDRIAVVSALPPSSGAESGIVRTVDNLREQLRAFALEHREGTLLRNIARDAIAMIKSLMFIALVSERTAKLTSEEFIAFQHAIPELIAEARREQQALRTLLIQEETDLLDGITRDLQELVAVSMAGVQRRLVLLAANLEDTRGKELGVMLETFLNEEIRVMFSKWRVQKDAWLDKQLQQIAARTWSDARRVVAVLIEQSRGLLSVDLKMAQSSTHLAMDARVTYRVTPVFYSLDGALLLLPSFVQRPWVLKKFANVVGSELDRNAGKIRFDYLERLERTFRDIRHSTACYLDEAVDSLNRTLTPIEGSESLLGKLQNLTKRFTELRHSELVP